MNKELRRIHHLTESESKMLLLFRHLSLSAQGSLIKISEMQIEADQQQGDNVVNIGSRTICK